MRLVLNFSAQAMINSEEQRSFIVLKMHLVAWGNCKNIN